jgi:hypothetical protein
MGEKATATATPEKASQRSRGNKQGAGPTPGLSSSNPFLSLQQTIGNQAMLQLLEAGVIQAQLRVSQPGDADEIEADRVAERVVSSSHEPTLHRKCFCASGASCPKCEEEQEGVVHRSVALPLLRSSKLSIQRAPVDQPSTPAGAAQQSSPAPARGGTHPLVVEDDAKSIEPHQMRKSQFIALLRTDACATADAVLASVGHTTKSCPYVEKWLSFYEKQSSQHIENAMRKYAPETATARSAHEAIRLVVIRIQRAAITWARTGKIEGLPEELASQLPGQGGFLGAIRSFAASGIGGAILGFIGGRKKEEPTAGSVSRKARNDAAAPTHDAAAVKAQLGIGHSLDSRVQSQMSSAFGYDFSGVRVHADSRADRLSSDLQARAFTVGSDVAFASGEYRPGTLIGDALIAHELAHVVQQGGGSKTSELQEKGSGDNGQLEDDADVSAIGAVATIWAGAQRGLGSLAHNAVPRLRSGLKLQACKDTDSTTAPGWTVDELKKNLTACDGATGAAAAAKTTTVAVGRTALGTGGSVDTSRGAITLDSGQDKCTATQVLIQELTNLSHKSDFEKLASDAAAGKLSREEYIRGEELQEYDGVRKVIQAFDACKDKWGCTTCEKEWARRYTTFDDYYDKALSTSHKEYYGKDWDARFKAAYEAKHPPAVPPPHH